MSFPFSKLSPAATLSAAEQMLENVKHLEALPSEERIIELITNIRSEIPTVIEALRKKRAGEYTILINEHIDLFHNEYDIFCDGIDIVYRRASKKVNGQAAVPTPELIACEKIRAGISKFGKDIDKLPRHELIGIFDAFIEEFMAQEIQDALTSIAVNEDYRAVCDTHRALKKLLKESSEAETVKSQILCAGKAGSALARSLGYLYEVVLIFANIGNSEYGAILSRMDETLDTFRPMINHKHKEDENDESDDIADHTHPDSDIYSEDENSDSE